MGGGGPRRARAAPSRSPPTRLGSGEYQARIRLALAFALHAAPVSGFNGIVYAAPHALLLEAGLGRAVLQGRVLRGVPTSKPMPPSVHQATHATDRHEREPRTCGLRLLPSSMIFTGGPMTRYAPPAMKPTTPNTCGSRVGALASPVAIAPPQNLANPVPTAQARSVRSAGLAHDRSPVPWHASHQEWCAAY